MHHLHIEKCVQRRHAPSTIQKMFAASPCGPFPKLQNWQWLHLTQNNQHVVRVMTGNRYKHINEFCQQVSFNKTDKLLQRRHAPSTIQKLFAASPCTIHKSKNVCSVAMHHLQIEKCVQRRHAPSTIQKMFAASPCGPFKKLQN